MQTSSISHPTFQQRKEMGIVMILGCAKILPKLIPDDGMLLQILETCHKHEQLSLCRASKPHALFQHGALQE